ncbi:MAG: DUF2059 domain-containing protein [Rhizobiaceae bacterium]|nr:DUF2059 domain-containing protein [Rhizobiaceae bacterium]
MYLAIRARHSIAAFAAAAIISFASPASAQEVAESHLKAARAAITALTATEQFDSILPQAAAALRGELIQKNPDLVQVITRLVDEETIALAPRRGDLEREAAVIYAKIFSEQQLNEIAAFYNSDTGRKLLEDGALVARQVHEAAGIWQRGIARDLARSVGTKLDEITSANAANAQQPTEGDEAQQVNQ